jgi:hypothetical protein
VRWTAALVPTGPETYRQADGAVATIGAPFTRAVVDALLETPSSLADALARARTRLGLAPSAEGEAITLKDLATLRELRALSPWRTA